MIGIYQCGEIGGVCYSYTTLHNKTFSPIDWEIVILDKVHGKTYEDKKEFVRDLSIDYSNMYDKGDPLDWLNIESWFYKYGKRYGLLREFHENGIC